MHPTSTSESEIDELDDDEVVAAVVVPSEMDGSMISYAASALTMNGGKVLCYSVGSSSSPIIIMLYNVFVA